MFLTSFTVDVEDWFHICGFTESLNLSRGDWRVFDNTLKLLDLFDETGVKGTFFLLGSVAEAEPQLSVRIAERGHEVASHGFSHSLVHELGPVEFRRELARTSALIADQTGYPPVGFRAPQWSLGKKTPWAFEILVSEGYLYDSSCSPLPFVGDPDGSKKPYIINTESGNLWEIPPLVTETPLGSLPVAGGWGFRFFPLGIILKGMQKAQSAGYPSVFYIHPREVDPDGPRLKLPLHLRYPVYGSRKDASLVIKQISRVSSSIPLRQHVELWPSAS